MTKKITSDEIADGVIKSLKRIIKYILKVILAGYLAFLFIGITIGGNAFLYNDNLLGTFILIIILGLIVIHTLDWMKKKKK